MYNRSSPNVDDVPKRMRWQLVIRRHIRAKGWSQDAMAAAICASKSVVANATSGGGYIRLNQLADICNALNIHLGDPFTESEQRKPILRLPSGYEGWLSRVRKEITAQGLTYKEVADSIGTKRKNSLSALGGSLQPTLLEIDSIIEPLGLNLSDVQSPDGLDERPPTKSQSLHPNETESRFIELVTQEIEASGMTRDEFQAQLIHSGKRVLRWDRFIRTLTVDRATSIADSLGLSMKDLIEWSVRDGEL
jgi:ribosome-binding protein aMBF1 (putative translation factor)